MALRTSGRPQTGASWTNVSGTLPDAPASKCIIDPNDGQLTYVGTDVGVFKSTTGGGNWLSLNNQLVESVVSDIVLHPTGARLFALTYGRGAYALDRNVPPAPALTAPANGASIPDTAHVVFSWTAAPGADSYVLELTRQTPPSIATLNVTTTSFDVGTLTASNYSWRVRAHNAAGDGPWTSAWTFQVTHAAASIPLGIRQRRLRHHAHDQPTRRGATQRRADRRGLLR